jgi:hypothetical protein
MHRKQLGILPASISSTLSVDVQRSGLEDSLRDMGISNDFPAGSLRSRTRIRISFDSVNLIGFNTRA